MRKIEHAMLAAIASGKDWKSGNTDIVVDNYGVIHIFLHSNRIATIADGVTEAIVTTLAQYPTATTKSRLRALGVNVTTKKGVTCLSGVAV